MKDILIIIYPIMYSPHILRKIFRLKSGLILIRVMKLF